MSASPTQAGHKSPGGGLETGVLRGPLLPRTLLAPAPPDGADWDSDGLARGATATAAQAAAAALRAAAEALHAEAERMASRKEQEKYYEAPTNGGDDVVQRRLSVTALFDDDWTGEWVGGRGADAAPLWVPRGVRLVGHPISKRARHPVEAEGDALVVRDARDAPGVGGGRDLVASTRRGRALAITHLIVAACRKVVRQISASLGTRHWSAVHGGRRPLVNFAAIFATLRITLVVGCNNLVLSRNVL